MSKAKAIVSGLLGTLANELMDSDALVISHMTDANSYPYTAEDCSVIKAEQQGKSISFRAEIHLHGSKTSYAPKPILRILLSGKLYKSANKWFVETYDVEEVEYGDMGDFYTSVR